jgi:hypothetical protein
MSEFARGAGRDGAEGVPDPASGGTPNESRLPNLQGLDEGLAEQPDGSDPSDDLDADRAAEAGSVSGSGIGDAPTSSSDPMPDMAGTKPDVPRT